MTIVSLNVNDFGGREFHREEYKNIFGIYSYLREWDKLNKSDNVEKILSYFRELKLKPDIIVLQEFDINSREAKKFESKMNELGYILVSESSTKRPSMTVFFIAKETKYTHIGGIHKRRNLRACAIETDNCVIYGTHIPPKYDEEFWDEIDQFVQKNSDRKFILIGDFNTINNNNKTRLEKLLSNAKAIDVWTTKGNSDPISIAGDYAIISGNIEIENVEIEVDDITLKYYTDHPVVILSLLKIKNDIYCI